MVNDIKFSSQELTPRLIKEFNYSPDTAQKIAEKLMAMDAKVKEPFLNWWTSGNIAQDFSINGYTFVELVHKYNLNPIAAFSMLDWMLREPEVALSTLKQHDSIV